MTRDELRTRLHAFAKARGIALKDPARYAPLVSACRTLVEAANEDDLIEFIEGVMLDAMHQVIVRRDEAAHALNQPCGHAPLVSACRTLVATFGTMLPGEGAFMLKPYVERIAGLLPQGVRVVETGSEATTVHQAGYVIGGECKHPNCSCERPDECQP